MFFNKSLSFLYLTKNQKADLCSFLKSFVKNYAVALTEASNNNLYDVYKRQFDDISKLQREAFEVVFRNGWYVLETAEDNKVSEKYNTLNQCFIDLDEE